MTGKKYTSKDIVQMAVQAKARGVELYLAFARNSENYHVGKLFTELAKDEQRHKMELEKWLAYLGAGNVEEAYPGESSLYLKSLVDASTFNCGETQKRMLGRTVSEEEALQAGVTFEKDLMLFLHELKQHVAAKDKDTVDALIDDEIRHLREMFYLIEKLRGKEA